jgi:3-dehydroquinate synthase
MKIVKVNLAERSYRIMIGAELKNIGASLASIALGPKIMVISNQTVNKLYGKTVENSLFKAGFDVYRVLIGDGERFKTQDSANKIYQHCLAHKLDRHSSILALGGGVVGDLAGYAAANYLRGINFVQAPTTLLAQVDSSVGGKVGVNMPGGKNLIGAFYQPKLVYIDPGVLKTLPDKELANGLAEVIKYGVIYDRKFFAYLEKNISGVLQRGKPVLESVISRSCQIKALIVSRDEKENDLRAILNFGHTLGHALETLASYRGYTHGKAVAIGMVGAMKIAVSLELIDAKAEERLIKLLERAGLPVTIKPQPVSWGEFYGVLRHDKKAVDDKLRFILPVKIGQVTISDRVPVAVIQKTMAELMARSGK